MMTLTKTTRWNNIVSIDKMQFSEIKNTQTNIPYITNHTNIKIDSIIELEENKLTKQLENILKYIVNFPKVFIKFRNKYPEFIYSKDKIEKNKTEEYINDFFSILEENIWILFHLQKIEKDNKEIFYKESLLRTKNKKDSSSEVRINHIDLLNIYYDFWKSIEIFEIMTNLIFKEIHNWNINHNISINAHVSDILNEDFLNIIINQTKTYNIELRNWDIKIIIEILEKEKIPRENWNFKTIIEKIKSLWIYIALDDILDKVSIEESIKDIEYLTEENVDIVKVDWKKILDLFYEYKNNLPLIQDYLDKIKAIFEEMTQKWITIIAEWIESQEILKFAREKLWINHFQWFYIDKN